MLEKLIKKIPGAERLALRLGLVSKYSKGAELGVHEVDSSQNIVVTPEKPETNGRRFLLDLLPKHSVGAEIGVHLGDFSQQILDITAPEELHLIDPWEHQTLDIFREAWYGGKAEGGQKEMDERYSHVCKRFDQEIRVGQVKVHRGYSTDMLEQFPDEYFDWVYIDGNHLYEYVKKDLEVSLRKTKSTGLITGDDYIEGGWWKSGIIKAVDEFSTNGVVQLVEIRNRQFIFRKS